MVSPVINVVRYSALLGGIGYGIVHQRTLQKQKNLKDKLNEERKHDRWVHEAQLEWQRRKSAATSGVITDPDNPAFDLEKLLLKLDAESK
ncbi:hypothetical protein BT69DRAFT_1359047 [Atractiella rhizophila]|nr:hypothetical protein BT69DRAFT_1359047 [Atractiella rhizophila]